MVSLLELLFASLVVLAGSIIQGFLGYGVGLFSAPLLFLINPVFVPAPLIIIGGLLPVMVFWSHRHKVQKYDLLFAYPGSVLGVGLAAVLVDVLPQVAWEILFALLILLAVILSWSISGFKPRPLGFFFGSLGTGFMGTLTSVGGRPQVPSATLL